MNYITEIKFKHEVKFAFFPFPNSYGTITIISIEAKI